MSDVTETEVNATSDAAPAKKGLPKMGLVGGGASKICWSRAPAAGS